MSRGVNLLGLFFVGLLVFGLVLIGVGAVPVPTSNQAQDPTPLPATTTPGGGTPSGVATKSWFERILGSETDAERAARLEKELERYKDKEERDYATAFSAFSWIIKWILAPVIFAIILILASEEIAELLRGLGKLGRFVGGVVGFLGGRRIGFWIPFGIWVVLYVFFFNSLLGWLPDILFWLASKISILVAKLVNASMITAVPIFIVVSAALAFGFFWLGRFAWRNRAAALSKAKGVWRARRMGRNVRALGEAAESAFGDDYDFPGGD